MFNNNFSRFRDTSSSFDASSKRYVITNPPDDFMLLTTDQVWTHDSPFRIFTVVKKLQIQNCRFCNFTIILNDFYASINRASIKLLC